MLEQMKKFLFLSLVLIVLLVCIEISRIYNDSSTPPIKCMAGIWYEYDAIDWTLHIKGMQCDRELHEFANIPKDFLKGKVIKRIIHANGTIENRGCTNYTKKCEEAAHFNLTINATVNNPPCCRQNLLDTLDHVTRELQRLNISHFLAYGCVIGWMRNKKMIPTDHDFDVMVEREFMHSKRFDEFLDNLTTIYGHHIEYPRNVKYDKVLGKKVWVFSSKLNRNGGDIWPYHIKKEGGRRIVDQSSSDGYDQPYENVFPLNRVNFHGFPVFIPRRPKEYLEVQYGKDNYKKRMTCKKVYDGNCLN